MSDQELEVEEVVKGTGMVGGTYRLLATGPSTLTSYITDGESGDDVSDVEVSCLVFRPCNESNADHVMSSKMNNKFSSQCYSYYNV